MAALAPTDSGLVGRHVVLRQATQADYPFLYHIETSSGRFLTYRHRGVSPGPERFAQSLWSNVLTHFVVVRRDNGDQLGATIAYADDLRNGHVRVAAVAGENSLRLGWTGEAWELFVSYLFDAFPVRKLYADVLDFNLDQFAKGMMRTFSVEGRLREHEYLAGTYRDLYILALYRSTWSERNSSRLMGLIREREREAESS